MQQQYIKIFQTLVEILNDRNYEIDNTESVQLLLNSQPNTQVLNEHFENNEVLLSGKLRMEHKNAVVDTQNVNENDSPNEDKKVEQGSSSTPTIIVIHQTSEISKIGKTEVNNYIKNYQHVDTVILVYTMITPNGRQCFKKHSKFHLFQEKELCYNITHHCLYVPHRALNDEEEKLVLQKFKTDKDKFPRLLRTDPIARYFGFKIGQLIQINRRYGGTTQPQTFFRIVCDENS